MEINEINNEVDGTINELYNLIGINKTVKIDEFIELNNSEILKDHANKKEGKINFKKGLECSDIGDYKNMIHYYELAIDKGHIISMYNLGLYYQKNKDYNSMIKYYKMATDKGHINSMFNFGLYYKRIKDYDNMIKYYKLASDKGHQKSKLKLDDYYKKNKPHKNKEYNINKEDNSIKLTDDKIIIDI